MAIVQISQITNRKGAYSSLPQLAGAELGWAIDTRQLFIGNGTLQEGAPVIGNTEILTEFSDILLTAQYVYQGAAAGYIAQTGPTSGSAVSQNLQSWMDQWASVTDFGATGDGVTDDTEAINRALYQLYCVQTNPQIRRSLFFPAGVYRISEYIIIPPYAKLYGEGANSSVIQLDVSSDISSLSAYCARYGDSLQQTGAAMGDGGATLPTNIEICSMGFSTVEITDVFLVEDASFCTFTDVSFNGILTTGDLTTTTDDIAAVRFSSVNTVTNNITFRRCEFAGLTYGISTEYNVRGCEVTESKFDTLYQGVLLGDPAPIDGGPTGFRVLGNSFDNIYAEGFKVSAGTSLNMSGYNIYYDVGNHFGGVGSPATSVITFDANNNVSIGDMFERGDSSAVPRIDTNNTICITTENGYQLSLGNYVRFSGLRSTLVNNTSSPTVIFAINATLIRAFAFDYTVVRGTTTRTGTVTVVASTDGTGVNLNYSDSGLQNSATGVAFTATETGSSVSIRYTTTNTGSAATLTYSTTKLA
jgi:hypothetical protein